jgi:hypothetical protein
MADNELPQIIDDFNDLPTLIYTGRQIAMPSASECAVDNLQRNLADAIIRMVSMDELRILLACGAKVKRIALVV